MVNNTINDAMEVARIHLDVALRCQERSDVVGVRYELRHVCLVLAKVLRLTGEFEIAATLQRQIFISSGYAAGTDDVAETGLAKK